MQKNILKRRWFKSVPQGAIDSCHFYATRVAQFHQAGAVYGNTVPTRCARHAASCAEVRYASERKSLQVALPHH
jgi:hypothetical protein